MTPRCLRRLFGRGPQRMVRVPPTGNGGATGEQARVQAERNLSQDRARWPEVRAVSSSLRDLRERNHFAENIQHIFEGGSRS